MPRAVIMDFKKIDASGRISALYHSIPAHLAKDARKYRITTAIGKRNNTKAEELLYELTDSKTILPCYNSTDPRVSLADTKDFDSYKLYRRYRIVCYIDVYGSTGDRK